MEKLSLLKKNEQEANRFASRVMLFTTIFLVLVYLMNVVGLFIVPKTPMLLATVSGIALLLIPSFIVFVLKCRGGWVKYAIVAASVLMTAVLNIRFKVNPILLTVLAGIAGAIVMA
jgi:O-antigen ligase